jgi:hypothetical protein
MTCKLDEIIKTKEDKEHKLTELCNSKARETYENLIVDCACVEVPHIKMTHPWRRLFMPTVIYMGMLPVRFTISDNYITVHLGSYTSFWIKCTEREYKFRSVYDYFSTYEELLENISNKIIKYKSRPWDFMESDSIHL